MPDLVFVGSASGVAGQPLHVTVYDGFDQPVDPATVTWQLPAGVTATPDTSTTPPSVRFDSRAVGSSMDAPASAVDSNGIQESGLLRLTFAAPPLKFTSP